MTDVPIQPEAEANFDRYGRYLLPGRDGKERAFTRVTTFAATTDDRWALEQWKCRMSVSGAVFRPDLFAQVAANINNKKKLNAICDELIEAAKGSAGANLGNALHTFTEQVDLGLEPIVPAPWDADVAAYRATLEQYGIHIMPEYVERIVVHHDLGIAGKFDRIVTVDGWPLPCIADLKTGNLDHASAFGAIAVQLSAYSHAQDLYDATTNSLAPMPEVDQQRALVIHLPAGQATCTLHVVDVAAGWQAAQLCAQVREWRKRKDLASTFATSLQDRVDWLRDRVLALRSSHPDAFAEVASCWPADCPTFKQGGHTVEHVERIALIVSAVEAKHVVPFGDPDPANTRVDEQTVVSLVTRLKQLPEDLLEAVRTAARSLDIPNVESHRFKIAHLADLKPLIVDAEQAAAQRTSTDVQEPTNQGAAA